MGAVRLATHREALPEPRYPLGTSAASASAPTNGVLATRPTRLKAAAVPWDCVAGPLTVPEMPRHYKQCMEPKQNPKANRPGSLGLLAPTTKLAASTSPTALDLIIPLSQVEFLVAQYLRIDMTHGQIGAGVKTIRTPAMSIAAMVGSRTRMQRCAAYQIQAASPDKVMTMTLGVHIGSVALYRVNRACCLMQPCAHSTLRRSVQPKEPSSSRSRL